MGALADEMELWASYRPGNCHAAHQELFFRYAPWARAVARDVYRRIRVPQVEWGDYAHNAQVGLLEAMSRFDPSRGIDFVGYAKARVRGAVFNGLRSFLAEYRQREPGSRMRDRLDSFDGGEHEDALSQVISSVAGLGLGFLLDAAASSDVFRADHDASSMAERHQMDRLLEESLADLPDQQRLVMTLHYHQHVPFVEIAVLLRVSKGRVSQIHRAAIEGIRQRVHTPQIQGKEA
jgi:RNA polymerase sigma factor for flagellar operon FliA